MPVYDRLLARFADFNALSKAQALMAWDQQVLMPPGGTAARSAHLARLGRMAHEILIADETKRLAEEAEREVAPGSDEAAAVRAVKREIDVRQALPAELVERKSRVSSDAYQAWRAARAENDFPRLAPHLKELFAIARETAERRGFSDHVYDPLIDLFEEGATYTQARAMFDALKEPTRELIGHQAGKPDATAMLLCDKQEALRSWAQKTAKTIGYDFNRGRLDITTNAFCTNFSCGDVRMTTRPNERMNGIVFSSLHEMGHGLYEQNSPKAWDRTPLAGGISLGVHESQSRLWENIVGRSLPFWKRFLPDLQSATGALVGVKAEQFCEAINRVEPGPIRIGSDELSYNLHILVRFELECEILEGRVSIADLPEAWNAKYTQYLGVTPKNDSEGCLQDVHWSRGSVGYFPTYSMGNLISWQVWESLLADVPDADMRMEAGDFAPILGWLTDRIYSQGKRYRPHELVQRATGNPMGPDAFLRGMRAKYGG